MIRINIADKIYEPSTFRLNRAVCSDCLQHQNDRADVRLVADEYILQILATCLDDYIPAKIYDNNKLIFTGIIKTDFSWTDNGNPFPVENVDLIIEDNTDFLNQNTSEVLSFKDVIFKDVITELCDLCGIAVSKSVTATESIPILVIDENVNIRQILDELCLQYGYVFHFNAAGKLDLFDYSVPENIPIDIGSDKIMVGAKIRRTSKNYKGVKITYNRLIKKENELVYFSGANYNTDQTLQPTVIQPGVYFPFEAAPAIEQESGQVWQEYQSGYAESRKLYNGEIEYRRSNGTVLLYTENARILKDWEGGELTLDRQIFGLHKASVRLLNTGTTDVNLYSISIRADAYYSAEEQFFSVGDITRPYTLSSAYITDRNSNVAEKTGKELYKYFVTGKFSIRFRSESFFDAGSFVKLTLQESSLDVVGLIRNYSFDEENQIFTYDFISTGAAGYSVERARLSFQINGPQPRNGRDGKDGLNGFTVYSDKELIIVQTDSEGTVLEPLNQTVRIYVQQGAEKADFYIHPSIKKVYHGMEVTTNEDGTVNVCIEQGNLLADVSEIKIPIIVRDVAGKTFIGKKNIVLGEKNFVIGRHSRDVPVTVIVKVAKAKQGVETYNVYSEKVSISIPTDSSCRVLETFHEKCQIHAMKGDKPVNFFISPLAAKNYGGIIVTQSSDNQIEISAVRNDFIQDTLSIKIPVYIKTSRNCFLGKDLSVIGQKNVCLGYSKTIVFYIAINISASKQGVQGEKGTAGKSPYVQNGYWWIDGINTEIKAEGRDGTTPHIGTDGYWYIGGTNTGIKAQGAAGKSAPEYIGPKDDKPSCRNDGSPLVGGDTFLSTSERKLYKWSGTTWDSVPDDDSAWWAAMGDAINYASNHDKSPVAAADIWAGKLIAGTMLADKIMAKVLEIKNVMKSSNYNGSIDGNGKITRYGTEGFAMTKTGEIDAVNAHLTNVKVDGASELSGLLKQGLQFFALMHIHFFIHNGYINLRHCTLDPHNIRMSPSAKLTSDCLTIERLDAGIYKFRILKEKLNTMFPVLWSKRSDWSYIQLIPQVRYISDKVDVKTYSNSKFLVVDNRFQLDMQIKRPFNAGYYYNGYGVGSSDIITNATAECIGFADEMGVPYTTDPVSSWVLVDGWYEFYVLFTDRNTDAYIDPFGGADFSIVGYFF